MRISPVVGKLRARVAVFRRDLRERGGDIQFRDGGGGGANALRMVGGLLPDFAEDALLDFEDLLFGRRAPCVRIPSAPAW